MNIGDKLAAEFREAGSDVMHLLGRHQDVPATQPVPTAPTTEDHMSTFSTDLHRWAAVAEAGGEDGLKVFEAVVSNPEAQALLLTAARLVGLPLTPGTINAATMALQAVENTWHTAQAALQPQGQPQQPQTAETSAQPVVA